MSAINWPHSSVRKTSLIRKCHYCNCDIDLLTQIFYTVGKEDPVNRKQVIKMFCLDCFKAVAGTEFL